jgi:hypothetical protein
MKFFQMKIQVKNALSTLEIQHGDFCNFLLFKFVKREKICRF